MSIRLNDSALAALPAGVNGPGYARASLSAGILHIGVGNFHRAHQAVYLDRLFAMGLDHDWAIIGAGVKPYDAAMREKLVAQDCLTTVVELDPKGLNARVTGAMIDFLAVDPEALIEALARPEIRIVSLTVTEGGYFVDARTGGFDRSHPEILADVANPDAPRTVFGLLIAGLRRRRAAGVAPFTVMSCDNLPENGAVTRRTVLGLAEALDPDLASWIATTVAFPNGMVDCITPATSDRERALVKEQFGLDDAVPVACEPFRQWVLEDHFPSGRPALEKVGVEFVEDVALYELMKLRILNGGHAAIAYPAGLLGIHYVHDAMAHPLIRAYLHKLETEEIIPTLAPIRGVNFADYLTLIEDRFSNAAVGDTIPRLCLDGSNRQPKFILPTLSDRLAGAKSITGLALELALWCRYCAATTDAGEVIRIADERADSLTAAAMAAREKPSAFLAQHDIFGRLGEDTRLQGAFAAALSSLWHKGTEATLEAYIAGTVGA